MDRAEMLDKLKIRLEHAQCELLMRERWVSETKIKINMMMEIIGDLEGEK